MNEISKDWPLYVLASEYVDVIKLLKLSPGGFYFEIATFKSQTVAEGVVRSMSKEATR